MFDKLKKALKGFTEKISKTKPSESDDSSDIASSTIQEEPVKPKIKEKIIAPEVHKPLKEVEKLQAKVGLVESLTKVITETKISKEQFEKLFSELEPELLQNNVALEVVLKLRESLDASLIGKSLKRKDINDIVENNLKTLVQEIFESPKPIDIFKIVEEKKRDGKPTVILFVGSNGHGKTSTIAKLAYAMKQKGFSSVFAASDTFRAAAAEQLTEHADKLGIRVIKHDYGADPAAVAFDCIKHAKAQNIDVVMIDTAGRQHTNKNLMDELKKIKNVAKPDITIFIVESIAGNDAWQQAKTYNEAIGIDGVILTKTDVDDRGGTFISIVHQIGKPILFITTGQNYEDLKPFVLTDFITKIIG